MQEVWNDVLDYEGLYQVSDLGRVKNKERTWVSGRNMSMTQTRKESILKHYVNKRGYHSVCLCKNGVKKYVRINRLVWEAFNGKTDLQVDHIVEGNKSDNSLNNLQILSGRQNSSKYKLSTEKTSQYTGVSWAKDRQKWRCWIHINGKNKYLGCFISEIEASEAYQKALNSLT